MVRKPTFFLLLLLLLSVSFPLPAQNHTSDVDLTSLSNKEKVEQLAKLCWKYREKQTDQALAYGLEGIKIAKAEGYEKELAALYNYVGVIYQHYLYEVHKGMQYYNLGLPLSLRLKDSVEVAYVYNNLGDAFYAIGNVPLAFEYGNKSLRIFERLHNQRGIAYGYINLGEANRISERYDSALNYFQKAIQLRKSINDSIGTASATLEVARTLFLMGKTDSAMYYYRQSLAKHRQINNKNYMAYSMQGMGDIYLRRNQLDSANEYFKTALRLCRERQNPTGEIESLLGIVKILAHERKKQAGEKLLDHAMIVAKRSNLTPNILKVFKAKGAFYHQLGEYRKASDNYRHYIHTYDSLYSALQFQTLNEVKERFRMTEKLNTANNAIRENQMAQVYGGLIILLLIILSVVLVLRHRTVTRLSAALMKSNESKDKIFSIISHDLISPFNVLMGTGELLAEDLEKEDLPKAKVDADLIRRTSAESYHFVSNLLHWSRTQRDAIKLNKEAFDISNMLYEVKLMQANQAQLKQITVNLNAPPKTKVVADQNLIQIVLVNLLNNALKFTPAGGTIDLSLEKSDDQIKVSVKDNGIGIAPDRIDKLFKTIDSLPGTNREKGTGLGLLLCKEFVELHGSKMHVNSREGEGSVFWFLLPSS